MPWDDLPPGVLYLLQRAPKIISPPTITYVSAYLLRSYAEVYVSTWLLVLAMILSLPVALTIVVLWEKFSINRDAARVGAVLPPSMSDDRSPGSLSTLIKGVKMFKKGYPGDGFEKIIEKVGGYTFNRRILFENRIITADPDHIKAMLATQFDDFEKGAETRSVLAPLLGTGVFSVDGELWKFHRSMTRPFFTRDRISHFDIFDRHAEDAINQLKQRFQEGHPVDFQDLVAKFTLDSAAEFLFGYDVQSLSGRVPYPYYVTTTSAATSGSAVVDDRFVKAFSEAQLITALRMRFGVHWPLVEFWKNKLKEPLSIVNGVIDPIVAEAIKRKRDSEIEGRVDKDSDDETLLENLVKSTEDPVTLRDEILSLLVAGRDTTAGTLTFAVYMLAEHPNVLLRLRQEILEKVGPQRRPTYDDFRELKYLRAVINETLRLYPVVPFNVRTSNKATIWPNKTPGGKPFYIPANTRTPYAVFLMHRRTDLWGPDALEFDPDRFLDDRLHKYLTPNPFIFLPFNAGPRICLGQQFAYNEASFFLVRLLQSFSTIALVPEAQPPLSRPPASWAEDKTNIRKAREKIMPKSHLTMYVQDGLWVTMRQAS